MREDKFCLEVLGRPIDVIIHDTADGINVLICGGDRPHIGAVSVKQPGEALITHEFPSHRDSAVSDRWASKLSDHFNAAVTVSAGIHYDNITREEIGLILSSLDDLLGQVLSADGPGA